MINYPAFALRRSYEVEDIDGIIYVNTFRGRYVLDDRNLESNNFLERRVLMLTREYECSIYPLKFKCENVIQVNRVYRDKKYSKFIDAIGRISVYTPKELVKVTWKKCKSVRSADGMFYASLVPGEPYHFVTKEPYNYLAIISYKGGRHIYDMSNTKPEKEEVWRKI